MKSFSKAANKTSQDLLNPSLILTNAGAVAFPPKWCHFLCDDVITELDLFKRSQQETKTMGNYIEKNSEIHYQLQQKYLENMFSLKHFN